MSRRKHILLKNEIDMIQEMLLQHYYPTERYISKIVERLEELKKEWYKSKS